VSRVAPVTLAAAAGRVYFHDGDRVVCQNARSGQNVWASKPIPRWKPMHVLFGPTLVIYQDVVLLAGGEKMDPLHGGKDTMTALSAKTGDILWTAPHPPSGYASAEDLFIIDGLVWCGVTTNRRDSGVFTGRDPHTGEVKIELPHADRAGWGWFCSEKARHARDAARRVSRQGASHARSRRARHARQWFHRVRGFPGRQ
jgi:hypothetical protein